MAIDRIDNDGNYCPANVRWADCYTQSQNRRSSILVTAFGETKCVAEWARDPRAVVDVDTLRARIRAGFDHQLSIVTPAGLIRRPDVA